ncbi:MAG: hypothetical protein H8K04_18730 [Nitrospira sp.]
MRIHRLPLAIVGILALGLSLVPLPVLAQETARELSSKALQECTEGRVAEEREVRLAHFQRGQALGEQAVAADEQYPDAHFSLFCNLGELLRVDGESLTSVFGLRRMMKELDRTLELAPHHIDARSAKGTLLVKLPGILGGDSKEGERLLQQVVDQAPKAVNARLALAKVRCEHGHHQEAVTLASDALAIAQKLKRVDFIPEARAVLQQLLTKSGSTNYKPQS